MFSAQNFFLQLACEKSASVLFVNLTEGIMVVKTNFVPLPNLRFLQRMVLFHFALSLNKYFFSDGIGLHKKNSASSD